jgi:hypothetical protein
MNYGRLALAALAATVVDGVYGFLVYGQVLSGLFGQYPAVFRGLETQTAYLPAMFLGIFIGMLAVAWIYAKGYEGRGVLEGARFGVLVGVFNAGYVIGTDYGILNIGRRLAGSMALAGLVEWLIVGVVVAAVSKPSPRPGARAAGV